MKKLIVLLLLIEPMFAFGQKSLIKEAAKNGDAAAQYELSGKLNYPGKRDEAFLWCKKSAENGYVLAQYTMGLVYEEGYGRTIKIDMTKAVWWFKAAAQQGHVLAQYHLAELYSYGSYAMQKSYHNQWKDVWYEFWMERPADAKYEKYLDPSFTNDEEAFKWYMAVAKTSNAEYQQKTETYIKNRQAIVANSILFQGLGKEIRRNLTTLHADAQYAVGYMYRNGFGTAQNYEQSVVWYRKAAEQDYVPAVNDLGEMYENGWGVKQDYAKAFSLYQKAIKLFDRKKNNESAVPYYNLARMYENGWGVKQNKSKAIKNYWRAADKCSDTEELMKKACSALWRLGKQYYYNVTLDEYYDENGNKEYVTRRVKWSEKEQRFVR